MEKEMREALEGTGQEAYLDTLADKMEALGLADGSYVNQLSHKLEPILGESEEEEEGEDEENCRTDISPGDEENQAGRTDKRFASQHLGFFMGRNGFFRKEQTHSFARDPVTWLLLLFTAVVMSVILKSGFYTDDIILSYQSKYFIWDTGTDIGAYLKVVLQSWLNQGRFFPVSNIYVSLLMHYVSSAFAYKLLILCFVVWNVYAFGAFIRKLTESRPLSLLAMAVAPLCFQIRAYHDGLIAYHLLMQVVFFLLLSAAMALQQFLEKKKLRWLFVSLVPYTIGLLTYEAAYISIFLLCFLVLFYEAERIREAFCWRNIKRTFCVILPYFLIMASLFFVTLWVKKVYGISYEGIQPEFAPGKVFLTIGKQVFSAVPLSYHLCCNDNLGHIFHNNPIAILKTARLQDFAAAFFIMAVAFYSLKEQWKSKRKLSLLGIGFTLVFAPAVLIGISARYQKELFWGIGHIPVYLEYFGITVLGIMLVGWLLSKWKKERLKRILAGFCSLVLAFVLLVQIQDNRAVIELMNEVYLYPRQLLDESLEKGIFSELEDGSILLLEQEALYLGYPGKEYFSYKTGKHLEVYRMDEFLEMGYPEGTPVYRMSYKAEREEQTLTLMETTYNGNRDDFTVTSIYTWLRW